MKNINLWVASSGVIGPTVSYSSVYLFHIFVFLWVVMTFFNLLKGKTIKVNQAYLLYPVYILFFYSILTVFWHPDFATWARYIFYLICGLFALFSVYQYVSDRFYLSRIFLVLASLIMLNILLGFFESLELIRLPSSKYSPYVGLYGYAGTDLSTLSEGVLDYLTHKPSGFNFNYNTFGFVMLLATPFVLFNSNIIIKTVGLLVVVWLLFSMGSKALFASFLLMILMFTFYGKLTSKKVIFLLMGFPAIVLLIFAPVLLDISSPEITRMYSFFEQLKLLISLIESGDITVNNSTTARAFFYYTGLQELFSSYGIGIGIGGIEYKIQASFHFFFLQMLVDLGVAAFVFLLYFYISLIVVLRKISFFSNNEKLSYYARASSLSLFIAIPASVAPSGVHYNLTFYLLIGFALAIIKVYNLEKQDESSIACSC